MAGTSKPLRVTRPKTKKHYHRLPTRRAKCNALAPPVQVSHGTHDVGTTAAGSWYGHMMGRLYHHLAILGRLNMLCQPHQSGDDKMRS
jgi:hypothetical protein